MYFSLATMCTLCFVCIFVCPNEFLSWHLQGTLAAELGETGLLILYLCFFALILLKTIYLFASIQYLYLYFHASRLVSLWFADLPILIYLYDSLWLWRLLNIDYSLLSLCLCLCLLTKPGIFRKIC